MGAGAVGNEGIVGSPFPLSPALSLGEREAVADASEEVNDRIVDGSSLISPALSVGKRKGGAGTAAGCAASTAQETP